MTEEKQPALRQLRRDIRVFIVAALSWFVLTVAGELIGGEIGDTQFGQTIGRYMLLAAIVVLPVLVLAWLWFSFFREQPGGREDDPPVVDEPPRWYRRDPLYGREDEVRAGVDAVRANGVVVIHGQRDVGTSAVGQAVVQKLIDDHAAEQHRTYRFDLRSRSARAPDDAAATAGRVVSVFDIDAPTDDAPEVLANVARLLVERFNEDQGTLMLDNVSTPEQVAWLVAAWPSPGPPFLVIAGEPAVGAAADRSTVEVGQLDHEHLRRIWNAHLAAPEPRRTRRWWDRGRRIAERVGRHLLGGDGDDLDRLLPYLLGRPKAVELLAREVRRSKNGITVPGLVKALDESGPAAGLDRVWQIILPTMLDGLTEKALWLLHALAVLPVTGLKDTTVAAILADNDATALKELRARALVEAVNGRFRLSQELRTAVVATTREERRDRVAKEALRKLLAFYAERAANWMVRLDTEPTAACLWFTDSEASLWPLVGTEYYHDDGLLEEVLDHLVVIADALDTWYVRERQASGLLKVSRGLFEVAERVDRPDLAALAAIRVAAALRTARRLGDAVTQLDIARPRIEKVRDDRLRSELDTRLQVERALLTLAGAECGPAFEELRRVLPKGRTATTRPGAAAVLLDLGALCLARGATTEALGYLHQAEELAKEKADPGCEAHSIELQGIALSQLDDRLPDAARRWQTARAIFVHLREDQGEARCLQHLGAAAITDTRVAALLDDGSRTELSLPEAAAVAIPLLERAMKLRAGQPDTGLAEHYHDEARGHLRLRVTHH